MSNFRLPSPSASGYRATPAVSLPQSAHPSSFEPRLLSSHLRFQSLWQLTFPRNNRSGITAVFSVPPNSKVSALNIIAPEYTFLYHKCESGSCTLYGADEGSRTPVACLEGRNSTTELHLHKMELKGLEPLTIRL